jgi:galactokinase
MFAVAAPDRRSTHDLRVTHAVFAPGRVNLIGEHTDYSGGLVLPVAVDLGVTVIGRTNPASIRLRSLAFSETVELGCDGSARARLPGWGRRVAAVARLLAERGRAPIGFDGTIGSTVPIGAGLSSSAALSIAVALALCRAAQFELQLLELARLAQEAEHLAVGVPCGLMDPATSLLGRRGHALLLDCGTEEYRLVPLPPDLTIVVLDSGVRRELEHSGYAVRQTELKRGLAALGDRRPADVTVAEATAAAEAAGVDDVAARRLRHVVAENERVRHCVAALEDSGGPDLSTLGALFREGHESLRVDFEVSTPELDLLVELACEEGAVAARMTGGGFGGSVLALVKANAAAALVGAVTTAYAARSRRESTGYICASVDGAGDVDVSAERAASRATARSARRRSPRRRSPG